MTMVRCTTCGTKFSWSFAEKGKWPDYCENPECKTYMGTGRADDDIVMPSLKTAKSRFFDDYYRKMEAGSEFRAEKAAELTGATKEEMSGLKITNLNDRRDAEIAAMPVKNTVTDFMAQTGQGGFQGGQGVEYSGPVQQGPFPNAGARTQTGLRGIHAQLTGGTASSDRPANEVLAPGYRRRG